MSPNSRTGVYPERKKLSITKFVAFALVGTLLVTLSAKMRIPLHPVPVTLHTLAIFVISAFFGARMATATLILYLLEGAIGLPVFAGTPEKGLGMAYMMGPTGGYLLGFVFSAGFVGWMLEKKSNRGIIKVVATLIGASILTYIPGLLWLGQFTGFDKVIELGMVPFLGGTALTIVIATSIIRLSNSKISAFQKRYL
jgi:biotin transport system substrate-specific component